MRKPLDYRSIDYESITFDVTFDESDPEILGIYCDRSNVNLYPYVQDFLIDALQEHLEETLIEEKYQRVDDQRKYDWDPDNWGKSS